MVATSEFLTPVPLRSNGKREWPLDLKARVVAETLIVSDPVGGIDPPGRITTIIMGL